MNEAREIEKTIQRRLEAILLLGPTGSGKTPLGNLLERHGLCGKRCLHFDFGTYLRQTAEGKLPGFTAKEVAFVRRVIQKGLLLENEQFCIAEKILLHFIQQHNVRQDDIVVLNGLPRHVGQARCLESYVNIRALVVLDCDDQTTYLRIKYNSGGDRTGRSDDVPELISKRLQDYRKRTAPLVDYFRQNGTPVESYAVTVNTTADELYEAIAADPVIRDLFC